MKRRRLTAAVVAGFVCWSAARASAEWRPADVRPGGGSTAAVLAAYAAASGTPEARAAQRRERWTYVNRTRRLPVRVAVRDGDFRASVAIASARYDAGRIGGVRWRADADGIAHATLSDDQGDAVDRLPDSVFPIDPADCALAGTSARFGLAWVLRDHPPHDRSHWLYVDQLTGLIRHEITREGARTIVTSFDDFGTALGMRRPKHWHVADGDAAHDLDVTVDAVEPATVAAAEVAVPRETRVFEPAAANAAGSYALPVQFVGRTIYVDGAIDAHAARFVLDTGTASVTLDRDVLRRHGYGTILEHAIVAQLGAGPLALANASVLSIPIDIGYRDLAGILGYDFFAGHVVHVDYAGRRVDVLTPEAAEPAFRDARTTVIPASFEEGVPLVHAAFGSASGSRFVLDTGSPHLYVLQPFVSRYRDTIDSLWTPGTFAGGRSTDVPTYLEGSIAVSARRVSSFTLGPVRFRDVTVGVEEPNPRADAIDIALDGIIGTDEMSAFEWWFDYDGGRIGVRRNGSR